MTKHIKIYENEIYEDDVAEINSLLKQLSPNESESINWETVQNVMKNATVFILRDHSPEILKEKPRGRIVGEGLLFHNWKFMFSTGSIDDVVVDEKYRGKGLGKILTYAMIEKAKKLGMKHIDCTSRPHRIVAHKLYEKAGFEKRDTNVFRLKL